MAVNRRAVAALSIPVILVVAIGLASGIWETPARLYSGTSGPLSSASVALPTLVVAGLADGLNPCAFTLLLLFVAAIASMYRDVGDTGNRVFRGRLLLLGGAFIAAIFVTYLTMGTGLLRASTALTQNHVGARLGALAAVFLGLWMIKDYLLAGCGPRLRAPAVLGDAMRHWGERVTLTAMFGLGILVGLCTVPCSGAVYLVILSMLALQDSFVQSYLYLVLYNVMFIVPLAAILAVASSRPALNRMAHWNIHHKERMRVVLGGGVVVLGLVILATV